MSFRLVVETAGRRGSFELRHGENLVGSAPGCDLAIVDPTISRHHACLLVVAAASDTGRDQDHDDRLGGRTPDTLSIIDLDSENGTWLGQERVRGARQVAPPIEVRFGAVSGWLDWVDAANSRPAPTASPAVADDDSAAGSPDAGRPAGAPPATTTSVGPLYTFTLSYLPDLVGAARRGLGVPGLAARVGTALLEALPCRDVVVEKIVDGAAAPLFTSRDEPAVEAPDEPASRGEADGFVVHARFGSPGHARVFTPVLTLTADLLALASAGAAVDRRAEATGHDAAEASRRQASPPDPPTRHPGLRTLYQRAEQIARGEVHVLIRGESGTGKELLARFIHDSSSRASGPFVALNCAALSRDLQEVELFGIERGMATGVEARSGRFEEAHGGTLFLDEIGDMALDVQAKILRVLQEKEVYRIGAKRAKPADVRVLSATHRDLDAMLGEGEFRSDLYHRIADWECRLPALRERRVDIANLTAFFLAEAAEVHGKPPAAISEAALDALTAYAWPGNVRQLERELKKASLFVPEGGLLTTEHLSVAILEAVENGSRAPEASTLRVALDRAEKHHIRRTLRDLGGDVGAASESLDVPASTLYRKIKKHAL